MRNWIPYTLPYLVLILSWIGLDLGGIGSWTGFFLIFGVLPSLEFLWPIDVRGNTNQSWVYDLLLLVAFPFLFIFLVWNLNRYNSLNSSIEELGCIFSVGSLMGVLSINVAHELIHRKSSLQKSFGVGLLCLVNFAHWGIEHVFGHHKNVATELDPASSREGENLYSFLFRNYFGGLYDSIKIERRRLNKNSSRINRFLKNRIYQYYLLHVVVTYFIYLQWGAKALELWFGQSLIAITLLLTVDYIEHYGLTRKKSAEGIYEAVRPKHSWDSLSIWSNFALFNLALHSHHHWKANVPFPDLREQKDALKMPFGYSVMVLISFCPPLFFTLMNNAKQRQSS